LVRMRTLDWYRSTFITRQMPDSRIVICSTRWHRDDLVGTLLKEMETGGEQWEVLKMPAISADGLALWPEMWPIEKLLKQKISMGSVEFEALYQQNPQSKEGAMFKREWFTGKIQEKCPWRLADLEWVRYWDLAATKELGSNDPDYTAGALIALDPNGQWWIADIQHFRKPPMGVEQHIRNIASMDGDRVRIVMEEEGGASGKITTDHYRRNVLVGFNLQTSKPDTNKAIRAQPLSAACEAGNVHLIRGDWINDFLNEVDVFPFGAHDDMVDAASGAFKDIADRIGSGSFEAVHSNSYQERLVTSEMRRRPGALM